MAAFSEAQIPGMDSPHTHFKPNYSSIIQLLKASETVMVHWGVVQLKIYAVRGVWTIQDGATITWALKVQLRGTGLPGIVPMET